MISPFPGMDPYLEGSLWSDVHHELASAFRAILSKNISTKYIARINHYMVSDTNPEHDLGIMYPDVDILIRATPMNYVSDSSNAASSMLQTSPITIELPDIQPVEVVIPVVEIRDREDNQLITVIEILSPVNKRSPGLDVYRKKRKNLIKSGVHLVEIDLLRRGERPIQRNDLPNAHYIATLVRAHTHQTDVWAFNIDQPMPVLPIPLKSPDPDVPLSLRLALDEIYERGMYERSIHYEQEPPPPDKFRAIMDAIMA
jgi:hypothetical protein